MSAEEAREGVENLRDTGEISQAVARQILNQPVESEKIVRLDRIEKETSRQSIALFGDKHLDPPGRTPGLLNDVYDLKVMVYRAQWTIVGGMSVCTFFLTLLGLVIAYVEASKH